MSNNLSYRVWCLAGLALLMLPSGRPAAEERAATIPREARPLEIARRHAGPRRAFDRWADAGRPDAESAIRRARAALFDTAGLLDAEPGAGVEAETLSRLKEQLLAAAWSKRAPGAEVHHLIAMLAFRLGDTRESLRHAACAVLAAPSSSRYHSNLAFFLQAEGRVREATTVYEHARRLDPDNTAAHLGLLSVASASDQPDLHAMVALARDWRRRERVPELREMADTLLEVLGTLRELDLPADGSERDSPAAIVPLVMAEIRELLPSRSAGFSPAEHRTPNTEHLPRGGEP